MAVDTMKKGSIEKQLLFLTRSSCFFVGKDHSEINRIMAASRLHWKMKREYGKIAVQSK